MDSVVIKPSLYSTDYMDYEDSDYSDDSYIYDDRSNSESNNAYHREERDKLSKQDAFDNMVP